MSDVPDPITLPPDLLELTERLTRVRALMAESDLDYYVAFDPINVYYLTNFANYVHERPFLLIVPRTGIPMMLVPKLELSHVLERARCELECVTYFEFPVPRSRRQQLA
jgi:Xaa-Pro dipeptidase